MHLSNRLAQTAWAPILFALICGCGSDGDGSSTGTLGTGGAAGSATGTSGTGGAAGATGTTDGGDTEDGGGGASGSGGAGGAAGGDAGAGKGGGAGKDGGAGKGGGAGASGAAGTAGAAGAGGSAGTVGDAGTTKDVATPPTPDAAPPPIDGASDDLIRELVARLKVEEFEVKCRALEAMSQPNRQTMTANYTAVTEWVKGWLATEAPSAAVTFDEWSGYRSVEIKIAGTDPAAGMYIIGGHLDSVAASPGMDDDGSGSLGVAMLASAMSHYLYKSEIRLLLFDAEESGLVGSTHYAQALLASGCQPDTCMKLFINMDMIGYDPRDTGAVRVRFDLAGPKMVAEQVKGYVSGLTITPGTGNCHSSDDCGFSRNGYPNAGELIEPVFNPQWHKVADTCDNMNFNTVDKTLQLAGAMLATMGGIHARRP